MTEVDLHPDKVTNVEMGYLYETDLAFGRNERKAGQPPEPATFVALGALDLSD